jgi:replicative DNA helicase
MASRPVAIRPAQALTTEEVRDIVFTPNDAVSVALDSIEKRRTTTGVGVRLGIAGMDDYMKPCRPGELITVLGMTSNYKSGFMQYWARHTAQAIVKDHIEDECVVYVTWEQAIEEMLAFDLAATARISAMDIMDGRISDEEMQRLRVEHGARRAMTPLYLIGHSVAEEKRRPRLTLDAVAAGLRLIRDEFNLRPRIVFLDYLQQIGGVVGGDVERRLQVFNNVLRCKDMALACACPVVVGCQANRAVYENGKWGVPGVASGLESSNIEHTSDKMFGVWLPKTTLEVGTSLQTTGGTFRVSDNLLIVRMLKQRMGPAGRWFPLYIDPTTNDIHAMDIVTQR